MSVTVCERTSPTGETQKKKTEKSERRQWCCELERFLWSVDVKDMSERRKGGGQKASEQDDMKSRPLQVFSFMEKAGDISYLMQK